MHSRVSSSWLLFSLSVLLLSGSCSCLDDLKFTIQPDKPGCYKPYEFGAEIITVAVTSYISGTGTPDPSVNGQTFYLRWSDLAGMNPGAAYIINADNPAQTTQFGGSITTTAVGATATFHVYVANSVPAPKQYQFMASDMSDPRLCREAYSCPFSMCKSGGFGDPQFIGLQGQSYQVHGRPDTLFNLISYPSHGFAMNSEFVYLAQGSCSYNNTVCWSHPGTYFGKMGIIIDNSTRVLVNSGPHQSGLQVYINDKRVNPSDNSIIFGSSSIHVVDYDRVEIRTNDFFVALVNSDMFLNLDISLLDKSLLASGRSSASSFAASKVNSDLHGLLGQTWRSTEYVSVTGVKRPYAGTTDDYIVDTPFSFIQQISNL